MVHAAGNTDTPTEKHFSMDFMNARDQLSSVRPDGRPDCFAVNTSLTKNGDGVLGVNYSPVDLTSKTPVVNQKGYYQIDGLPVRYDAAEFGGYRLGSGNEGFAFDRNKDLQNGQPVGAIASNAIRRAFVRPASSIIRLRPDLQKRFADLESPAIFKRPDYSTIPSALGREPEVEGT